MTLSEADMADEPFRVEICLSGPGGACTKAEVKPNNYPPPNDRGNTVGKIVPETSPEANPPNNQPETKEEKGWWDRWGSDVTHGVLGVASFVPGLSVVTGALDAGIYAAEGDYLNAGLSAASMIPGGKVVTTVGKGVGKVVKVARGVEKTAQATEDVLKAKRAEEGLRLEKEALEKAAKEKAEKEAAEAAAKKTEGGKVKGKEKLKCGDAGPYGKMQRKTGGGKFDRDHIPSKAALKARAAKRQGRELTPAEERAIDKAGDTIAIPREAHRDVSPTYGQTLKGAATDSEDLAGSAKRDIDAMLEEIDKYDADGGCKKAYKKAAKSILKKTNDEYDKWLDDIIDSVPKSK